VQPGHGRDPAGDESDRLFVVRLVLVLLVACSNAAAPCGDAIDAAFARKHAERQTKAHEKPEIRDALLDAQLYDDALAKYRRRLYLDHCVADDWNAGQRDTAARTGDVLGALTQGQRSRLAADRVRVPSAELLRIYGVFAAQMCQCTTPACAQRVTDTITQFTREMTPDLDGDDAKLYSEQLESLVKRQLDCMERATVTD
jgi:hypothetical protein